MPPFIPQKRPNDRPQHAEEQSFPRKRPRQTQSSVSSRTMEDNKIFLQTLEKSDDESLHSEIESDQFEDVSIGDNKSPPQNLATRDEDDDVDWENAIGTNDASSTVDLPPRHMARPSKDLEITLDGVAPTPEQHLGSKGPTRKERLARSSTHQMHVLFLLFHNYLRNHWLNDSELQSILRAQLPVTVQREVERWRRASGLDETGQAQTSQSSSRTSSSKRGRRQNITRNQRDWGQAAEQLEAGGADTSRGDPLFRLLKVLTIYWRKRFVIIAPSLRKEGYKPLAELKADLHAWRTGDHDVEASGERIEDLEAFRRCARLSQGSRDVGAQLFTALIRSIGIEGRLVASLQPLGFGWTQAEIATSRRTSHEARAPVSTRVCPTLSKQSDFISAMVLAKRSQTSQQADSDIDMEGKPQKGTLINLVDETESEAGLDPASGSGDDDSVVDVTPKTVPLRQKNKCFDKMPAPTYWTEAISPLSDAIVPAEAFICTPAVVTSAEHLTQFEPRGRKAVKEKQVFAYVIAYSSDNTAKEVTTRYMRRHQWPGLTKGVRIPKEKVPVYKANGKLSHHERYDWFQQVMLVFERRIASRTAVDDREDVHDLMPAKTGPKMRVGAEDTLQGYKSSTEFVLERHLRREEALRPGSKPVKVFTSGKGDQIRTEDVFLRSAVALCRTAESWHKEGRAIKPNEMPLKSVKIRAVTANRKREVEEAERIGIKPMQSMYAIDQTEYIIPDPIQDGVIPKNAYGNIDCFVPSMVPEGAVHIPLRNTVKVCKRLGIDYAEAVIGFDFGNRVAIPLLSGVVIAEEQEDRVMKEWKQDEEERQIKEEGKREKNALALWRKYMLGLRVLHRVQIDYGGESEGADTAEVHNPFTNIRNKHTSKPHGDGLSLHRQAAAGPSDGDKPPSASPFDLGEAGGFLLEDEVDRESSRVDALELHLDAENDRPQHGQSSSMKLKSPNIPGAVRFNQKQREHNGQSGPAADPNARFQLSEVKKSKGISTATGGGDKSRSKRSPMLDFKPSHSSVQSLPIQQAQAGGRHAKTEASASEQNTRGRARRSTPGRKAKAGRA